MTDTSSNNEEHNPSASTTSDNEIQDLQQEIAALKMELKEKNDKYLMVLAESENARKRMQKERQEMMQYAVENALLDFLVPMENMGKALEFTSQMSDEVKNWALGFNMILQQFKQVFEDKGIVEYSSLGQKFNPFLHEAVETEETTEIPEGTIIEEFAKGYKIEDRPIRVAKVKVAKAPSIKNTEEIEK
ncbi:Protein GrpE [Chlamydia avium]|uniref:Protein GrpE n=2 Tax=Chlamydia avium TaxID=1457141 RepID=W8JKX4_9CHLA|nr:nucleotide exchange factor GrpE [Chlamydia avium]AHK62944.1 Protein GrpE [Chlamydia avium 10DC88]EPP37801.1 grpE family protein [Chlamydia psittaci 10_743_SC13]EPP38487.1 grpE family protein [Chlamydia avium]VVT42564.1 Protein GrpE [Chlamydia avium]